MGGQTLPDVPILVDVIIVVEVNKLVTGRLGKDRDYREQKKAQTAIAA